MIVDPILADIPTEGLPYFVAAVAGMVVLPVTMNWFGNSVVSFGLKDSIIPSIKLLILLSSRRISSNATHPGARLQSGWACEGSR